MEAYGGKPGSALHLHHGLLYRVLDDTGRPLTTAIKASRFPTKPILKNLEKKFTENEALREPHRQHLTTAIDWAFYKKTPDLDSFQTALKKEHIDTILQKDTNGAVENIWYIDHLSKTVFDGKSLGHRYTANDITQRCQPKETHRQEEPHTQQQQQKIRPRLHLN